MERHTLLLIKPDSTKKNHTGAILKIVEEHGFLIKELKMFRMNLKIGSNFYAVHKGKDFYEKLLKFMQSGKTVAAVLQRDDAIQELRKLVGKTDYHNTKPETIRRIYGESITKNAVHASDSVEHAKTEIKIIVPDFSY